MSLLIPADRTLTQREPKVAKGGGALTGQAASLSSNKDDAGLNEKWTSGKIFKTAAKLQTPSGRKEEAKRSGEILQLESVKRLKMRAKHITSKSKNRHFCSPSHVKQKEREDGVNEQSLIFCFKSLQNTKSSKVHVEVDWQLCQSKFFSYRCFLSILFCQLKTKLINKSQTAGSPQSIHKLQGSELRCVTSAYRVYTTQPRQCI